ncbi:hypothetical protein BBO99_00003565 [Phytophthora kernoviae]|uniref:Uncharacterized protein n=1 Tax=Phytophthora kernoviae TaxID=325452 RepID=A0A421GU12_9STRA|nr:hypothetical protein BBO99_00003565 [Phytophthora kernoviae]
MHEVVHVLPHSGFITVRVLQYDEEDVSTFRELANNVDDQYEHTNRVLQLSGLHEATSEMVDAYICRSEGASSDLLKFCTCMLVPYEAHALERAVWENLKKDEVVVLGPKQTVEALTLPLGMASRLTVQNSLKKTA